MDKSQIIALLDKWISQRPGLEFGNYGDVTAYRSEMRDITKHMHHARAMLRYVEWHDSITAEMILESAKWGRLSFVDGRIDYCTGQYWPTEYRSAVCRLLSSTIWHWMRENTLADDVALSVRTSAERELGRSIARKWFN